MQCDWRISVSAGSTVSIVITDMEMEERGTCNFDYLEVNYNALAHFNSILIPFFLFFGRRFSTASMVPPKVSADFATATIQCKSTRPQTMYSCVCEATTVCKAAASI